MRGVLDKLLRHGIQEFRRRHPGWWIRSSARSAGCALTGRASNVLTADVRPDPAGFQRILGHGMNALAQAREDVAGRWAAAARFPIACARRPAAGNCRYAACSPGFECPPRWSRALFCMPSALRQGAGGVLHLHAAAAFCTSGELKTMESKSRRRAQNHKRKQQQPVSAQQPENIEESARASGSSAPFGKT